MIKLLNLTKSYPLFSGGRHYVFKDLTFEFPENCSIGLMGRNGAGKSTLMRLLSGSELPDRGKIITNKKLSWPLGLNAAFQGSLTARDNAKFVARVYGYKGKDLQEKVKFVEDFAEIGKFFDEPMKTYSSGMSARIAFGLSMAFDFDYYLIDEAGAVGDPSFREKSVKLYRERLSQSKVIMVSHDVTEIKEWCDKIIFMEDGKATVYDDVDEGIAVYQGKI
ncbi:ABC transporter ATP-binding protein [Campylobacter jejuni]|uniref:ABC transporter ATP-binding protein n=1 Tax=Campylobacter jejuni TaxID=197 RepID=UPI000F814F7C|nr:ABC transporter ATP-binding protein [Campylobacter jejuni]ECP6146410.1 ABC transporter ATP-binding protein [Campylobacter jejuni]EEP3530265.1 ABC transporter ATP-binding protein [Campylobacter jejuni]MCW1342803.1 ABC transporter ATP-binding protein [Campylobacter jejuni]RTI79981.1 ABC transporter ATP-binding protein [Campylobacter jejuni]RTI98495.1 ABC transporter ATP-binding protein [Campylobacter jejuni]